MMMMMVDAVSVAHVVSDHRCLIRLVFLRAPIGPARMTAW